MTSTPISRIVRKALISSIALVAPVAAIAQPTLIRDVRVFDGVDVHEKRSVLIDGNRIEEDDFRGPAPGDAWVVTCAGCTLMPGLIDAHVHLVHLAEQRFDAPLEAADQRLELA